jgi:nucleotide-binding universal stress UspA family protein
LTARRTRAALDFAVEIASRYRATLRLLHAFPHVSDLLGTPYSEHLLAARTLIGQRLLESAQTQVGDAAPIETQLVEGPPAPAILRVAADERCDMIVVGSRGHGQMIGLLLGSVSSGVAQHATCPVLIVHYQRRRKSGLLVLEERNAYQHRNQAAETQVSGRTSDPLLDARASDQRDL